MVKKKTQNKTKTAHPGNNSLQSLHLSSYDVALKKMQGRFRVVWQKKNKTKQKTQQLHMTYRLKSPYGTSKTSAGLRIKQRSSSHKVEGLRVLLSLYGHCGNFKHMLKIA